MTNAPHQVETIPFVIKGDGSEPFCNTKINKKKYLQHTNLYAQHIQHKVTVISPQQKTKKKNKFQGIRPHTIPQTAEPSQLPKSIVTRLEKEKKKKSQNLHFRE